MAEKKEQNKFTIRFNATDPSHQQVIDMLNQQGRRKAQFIVNAIQHYLHCPETPDIPQPTPVDIHTIEDIVRHILEKQKPPPPSIGPTATKEAAKSQNEDISFQSKTAEELLGQKNLEAIAHTISMFRKG